MKKLFGICVLGSVFILAQVANADPGQVDITLQSKTDATSWADVDDATAEGVKNITTAPTYFRVSIVPVDGGETNYSNVVQISPSSPQQNVNVRLESSSDLTTWTDSVVGVRDVSGGKEFIRATVQSIYDDSMVLVAAGVAPEPDYDYYISRFEISKEEWDTVRTWASSNGYNDLSAGDACGPHHPVVSISWYDAIKWCNALSEMTPGMTPLYYTDVVGGTVYRNGEVAIPSAQISMVDDGYRLPFIDEWKFAAQGGNSSQGYTYSGSDVADDVAIYEVNSFFAECGVDDGRGTWPLGSKAPNELDIFDMSGNVWEMVNDYHEDSGSIVHSHILGSSYLYEHPAYDYLDPSHDTYQLPASGILDVDRGFRIIRNYVPPAEAAVQLEAAYTPQPALSTTVVIEESPSQPTKKSKLEKTDKRLRK